MSDFTAAQKITDEYITELSKKWVDGDGPTEDIGTYLRRHTGWDMNEYMYWYETGRVMPN